MLASAGPREFAASLAALLDDDGVGAVLAITPPPPTHSAEAVCEAMIPVIRAARKPVVVTLMGENLVRQGRDLLREARIPDYRFPERAASALATLARRAAFLAASAPEPMRFPDARAAEARAVLDASAPGFLPQDAVARVLGAYGLALPRIVLAADADDAVRVAGELGYPVALKVASPDIPHKSDVGGVLLGLGDADAVRAGFAAVQANARRAHPGARLDGVHVQRMLPEGQEVIVGAVQDPQFGALVMFGAGGTDVEGVKDVAFALAPLPRSEAEAMLDATWAGRKLRGFRHLPPADRAAAIDAVARLGQLVADHADIAEVEINPLRVRRDGEGVVAVDVRLRKG
jgi:acetyltransferase